MSPDVRAAVLRRALDSGALCECGCGEDLATFGGEVDHFFGKARDESAESCWVLTRDCHYQKTNNIPSAAWWLKSFIRHQRKHGLDVNRALDRLHWVQTRGGFGRAS